tara:strand:+ start:470 stop:751 length:282 start_codon:yes stop_codon:yes gene_type:complete
MTNYYESYLNSFCIDLCENIQNIIAYEDYGWESTDIEFINPVTGSLSVVSFFEDDHGDPAPVLYCADKDDPNVDGVVADTLGELYDIILGENK